MPFPTFRVSPLCDTWDRWPAAVELCLSPVGPSLSCYTILPPVPRLMLPKQSKSRLYVPRPTDGRYYFVTDGRYSFVTDGRTFSSPRARNPYSLSRLTAIHTPLDAAHRKKSYQSLISHHGERRNHCPFRKDSPRQKVAVVPHKTIAPLPEKSAGSIAKGGRGRGCDG